MTPKDAEACIDPMGSRTAICRGAVHKGFLNNLTTLTSLSSERPPIKVTSTISRASYGSKFRCEFITGTHEEADKTWDEDEYRYMANNQMQWYLKRVSVIFHVVVLEN